MDNYLSVLDIFSNLNLFSGNSVSNTNYNTWENIFFSRFLIILWWLIIPTIVIFIICMQLYFFPGKRIFVKQKWVQILYPYNNAFHNFAFVFMICLFIFNTYNLCSYWAQIYLFKNVDAINNIWTFSDQDKNNSGAITYFVRTLHVGYTLHLFSTVMYVWYNMNKTDSFFSQDNWFKLLKANLIWFLNTYIYWEIKQKWNLIFQKIKKLFD